MDKSYGIFKYDINTFCTYIAYQTGSSLPSVKKKPQVTYISNYLNYYKNENIFFIYENEYIDQHYLEDYSSYHVRCFKNYKKTCSRVHFFYSNEKEIDHQKELESIFENKDSLINNDNYLGFIVIRPIPETFFAKICFKPYDYLINDIEKKYTLVKRYNVSLFGQPLHIDSIAFQEQDKVVSACATTSLWTFFHAHPIMDMNNLPSSNLITKSSYSNEKKWLNREFPNNGLSIEMISKSLKEFGFAPEKFEFSNNEKKTFLSCFKNKQILKDCISKSKFLGNLIKKKDIFDNKTERFNLFKEYIYTYCSSGMPLILGISIKDKKTGIEKGLHAVTVVGYSINHETSIGKTNKYSHRLEKIYVHDDRYGPYLRIDLKDNNFEVVLENNDKVSSHNNSRNEIYSHDMLITGVYHKIRIPYLKIVDKCERIVNVLKSYIKHISKDKKDNFIIFLLDSIEWDIKIKENSKFKSDVRNLNIKNKKEYLIKSLPKYIWSATARIGDEKLFELIFDATDIEFGDMFLDFIPIHTKIANSIYTLLTYYAEDKDKDVDKYDDERIQDLIKYFFPNKTLKDNLSDLYGYLKIPERINQQELKNDNIINQCDVILSEESDYTLEKNSNEFQYIWVVDIDGFLRIGKEYNKTKKGHPTLTNGMPARLGGQLIYCSKKTKWVIDPFSGRYSGGYLYEDKVKYLDNVLKYKFQLYLKHEEFEVKEFDKIKRVS